MVKENQYKGRIFTSLSRLTLTYTLFYLTLSHVIFNLLYHTFNQPITEVNMDKWTCIIERTSDSSSRSRLRLMLTKPDTWHIIYISIYVRKFHSVLDPGPYLLEIKSWLEVPKRHLCNRWKMIDPPLITVKSLPEEQKNTEGT